MLTGIKALLCSEKALAGGALVIAATILVALGRMTVADWQSYTQIIFYGYAGSKTVQGAMATWASTRAVTVGTFAAAPVAPAAAEAKPEA
jgi:hypothetical protein